MVLLVAAVEALNSTLGKAIGKLENIISTSEQAQKATLSLGQSLGGSFNSLGTSMDDLNGSFGQRLQVGIEGMRAGLQGNTAGVLKLLNEQQLLGQNFKATARVIARFESSLGLSREQTEKLGDTLSETSKKFGVSMDVLVKALEGIKNLPALRAAGLGGLPESVTRLAGQFGPALQGELRTFVGLLTDTSIEAYTKLSQLGIGDVRERFAAAGPERQVKILEEAIARAGQTIQTFDAGAESFFGKLSIADGLFGEVSDSLRALSENIGTRDQVQQRNKGLFTQQISVIKDNIFAPFAMLFSQNVFPQLSKFVGILGESLNPFLESLTEKVKSFGNSTEAFNKVLEITNSLFKGIIKVINFAIDGFNSFKVTAKLVTIALTPAALTLKLIGKTLGFILDGLVYVLEKINTLTVGLLDGVLSFLKVEKVNKLDPELFDLFSAMDRYLKQIAENTEKDPIDNKAPEAAESLREAMTVLNDTLYEISREAVGNTVAEEMRDLTVSIAANTEKMAEDSALPRAGSKV